MITSNSFIQSIFLFIYFASLFTIISVHIFVSYMIYMSFYFLWSFVIFYLSVKQFVILQESIRFDSLSIKQQTSDQQKDTARVFIVYLATGSLHSVHPIGKII